MFSYNRPNDPQVEKFAALNEALTKCFDTMLSMHQAIKPSEVKRLTNSLVLFKTSDQKTVNPALAATMPANTSR